MDTVFVIAAIIIVLLLAIMLPRWVRGASRHAAERDSERTGAAAVRDALDALGTTVLLACTETEAREVVDLAALALPRGVTILSDGGYGLRFIEDDDATAELVATPSGALLHVTSARERLGRPQTAGFWIDLRRQVVSTATTRGISTSDGPRVRHIRRADGVWHLSP